MAKRRPQLDLFGAPVPSEEQKKPSGPSKGEGEALLPPRRKKRVPAADQRKAAVPLLPEEIQPKAAVGPVGAPSDARGISKTGPVGGPIAADRSASITPLATDLPSDEALAGGPRVLGVGELARRIRGSLEADFGTLHVRGEISNLRRPASGHLYFSLKDQSASIRAVLFRGQARLLRFRPEHGQEVVARGRLTFYEAGGDAQIVCDGLDPVGAGALALAFEQLKAKLAKEGLFDSARKRPLPFIPKRIGLVTSISGAAIRDFLRVLYRRAPRSSVLVANARVQGKGAADEIVEAMERLCAFGDVDVIVLARGGGSIEDLWAFNEERLARAIAACPVPVVSAVGHEVDHTIADYVADLRAPTPTGAAELIAPVESDLRSALDVTRIRLQRAMRRSLEREEASIQRRLARLGDPRRRLVSARLSVDSRLQGAAQALRQGQSLRRRRLEGLRERLRSANPALRLRLRSQRLTASRARLEQVWNRAGRARREELGNLSERLWRSHPRDRLYREQRSLDQLRERLLASGRAVAVRSRAQLAERMARLHALSPLDVLSRGYAAVFTEEDKVVRSAAEVAEGQRLHVELSDGALWVRVLGDSPEKKRDERRDMRLPSLEGDGNGEN